MWLILRNIHAYCTHIYSVISLQCMEHMTLIPKPKESVFWQYTRRTIAKRRASAGLEEQQQQQQQQLLSSPSHGTRSHSPSPDRKSRLPKPETLKYMSLSSAKLPPGASKQLCEIFSAISSVERSKQVSQLRICLTVT